MLVEKTLYALGDVTVIPAPISNVRHRAECNVYYDMEKYDNETMHMGKSLPIFASPMASVINKENFNIWINNSIIPILPRTVSLVERIEYAKTGRWAAFGIEEFEREFCVDLPNIVFNDKIVYRALIDIANGHISYLQDIIKRAKKVAEDSNYTIEIMAGNVALPVTYRELAEAGADYVRCSVGTGSVCITSSNTSLHYPMASLLDECKKLKIAHNLTCKIVADGGISSYSTAIKALALGADYVMMGSTLAKCFESASEFVNATKPSKDYTPYSLTDLNNMRFGTDACDIGEAGKKEIIKDYAPLVKTIFGMSTRKAQTLIALAAGKKKEDIKTKTSEGIEKEITVDYTVNQWAENFTDYLRSAMSYCNFTKIEDFIGGPEIMLLSESAKNSINK